jgi:hypothetical protein
LINWKRRSKVLFVPGVKEIWHYMERLG